MPKKDIDYSSTIIYKISCKDVSITDLYVGHTTNFVQRKYAHKQSTLIPTNTCKLYNTIRNNGGWDNWSMEIVTFSNCADSYAARKLEQEYFVSLKATLNSLEPMPKPKENKEELIVDKIVIEEVTENKVVECLPCNKVIDKKLKYNCNICDYHTVSKKDMSKHLLTPKHKNQQKSMEINNPSLTVGKKYNCNCGKEYIERSGLWRHKKLCTFKESDEQESEKETPLINILIELLKNDNNFKNQIIDLITNKLENTLKS